VAKQNRTRDQDLTARGDMTVEEAGRRGGKATAERHGPEFYEEIGRKGGEAVSRNREHMAEIGRKGGEARSGHPGETAEHSGRRSKRSRGRKR
jgi:general stress protein YciG